MSKPEKSPAQPLADGLAAAFAKLTEAQRKLPQRRGCSVASGRQIVRGLRREYARLLKLPSPNDLDCLHVAYFHSQIDELARSVEIGAQTLKRWRRMLTQAQALAAQVMSEPGHAYAYRRRRYRRLLAQDRDLRNLLWLLGLALPLREQDARAEAFRVLEQRLGFSPPSRQEAAALRKHLSPGDAAAYHLSLQTCTCAVCAFMRTGAPPHDDALSEALQGCPCGVCFAFRKLTERAGPVLLAYGRRLGFAMSGFLALLGAKNVN